MLLDAGRPGEALGYFERALALRERALGPRHPDLAGPLTGRGEALVKLGRPAEALAPLERALSLRESHEGAVQELAETRFALARALWDAHQDTARARQLAKQAGSALTQPGSEALRARVQAWLAPRTPRARPSPHGTEEGPGRPSSTHRPAHQKLRPTRSMASGPLLSVERGM